jgi:hypothetical protein
MITGLLSGLQMTLQLGRGRHELHELTRIEEHKEPKMIFYHGPAFTRLRRGKLGTDFKQRGKAYPRISQITANF